MIRANGNTACKIIFCVCFEINATNKIDRIVQQVCESHVVRLEELACVYTIQI